MRPKYGTPYLFTSANPILFFTRHLKTHYFISAHLAPALAASVMRPDSLPRLWRYMSLTYLLTYNTRQFITEFLNKDWTKNSINRHAGEVQNSRHSTDFWAAGGAGACWWKCQQFSRWLAVADSGRQKPQSHRVVRETLREACHRSSVSLIIHKDLQSASQEKLGALIADKHTAWAYTRSVCSLRDDNVIKSQLRENWNMQTVFSFEYFC